MVHEQWCSISKFYQWLREQKDFHCRAAECEPTQWNAWCLVRGFQTTCNWTAQLVRLHEALPDARWFLPPLQDFTDRFEKIPSKPQCLSVSHTFFSTETPCQPLAKATLARIMFNCQTKIPLILDWCYAYLTVLTETEMCTITCPWQTDTCCTFYRTHYLCFKLVY